MIQILINHFYLTAIISLLGYPVIAQSINITATPETSANQVNAFNVSEGKLTVQNGSIAIESSGNSARVNGVLDWAISPGANRIGVINNSSKPGFDLYNSKSNKLLRKELDFIDPADESLKVYLFNNGNFIIRDNISNFTFYNSSGKIIRTIQNSSGSVDGEAISKLQKDDDASTIILYNPTIIYGNRSGSRARLVMDTGDTKVFYESNDRIIKNASISSSGSYVLLLTGKKGTDDRAILFDRFGNRLTELNVSEELIGINIDDSDSFITLFSSGRVQVIDVSDGTRIASSSFRSRIIHAEYNQQDKQILVLSGSKMESELRNVEIHSVHIEKRQITRSSYDRKVTMLSSDKLKFRRTSANRYELNGLNQILRIATNF